MCAMKDRMESVSSAELGLRFLFKPINIFLPIYTKAFRCTKSRLFFSVPRIFIISISSWMMSILFPELLLCLAASLQTQVRNVTLRSE